MTIDRNRLLYNSEISPDNFNFDNLQAPPISYYLSYEDVQQLNKLATSLKYNGNIDKKYKLMDQIMRNRGFIKYACGTNRRIYRHMDNEYIIFKVALDRVGIDDNPKEFFNQQILKPYVSKMFDCTPCGTVSCCERVKPIKTREEFVSVAGDVFDMLYKTIIGKYVLEDIGDASFMNYGIRLGFGVVILDYPYLYQTDLEKLVCKECGGYIDYDTGINTLYCEKCGKVYTAREISVPITDPNKNKSAIITGVDYNVSKMRFKLISDGEVLVDKSHRQSDIIL